MVDDVLDVVFGNVNVWLDIDKLDDVNNKVRREETDLVNVEVNVVGVVIEVSKV